MRGRVHRPAPPWDLCVVLSYAVLVSSACGPAPWTRDMPLPVNPPPGGSDASAVRDVPQDDALRDLVAQVDASGVQGLVTLAVSPLPASPDTSLVVDVLRGAHWQRKVLPQSTKLELPARGALFVRYHDAGRGPATWLLPVGGSYVFTSVSDVGWVLR